MADRIKGITIELDGETTGLKKALSGVTQQSIDIQKELTDVNRLLKFDPGNTAALAQKQELLSKQIDVTSQKLKTLKDAQSQVDAQFAKGDIGEAQYRSFQREIEFTEASLNKFKKSYEDAINPPKGDITKPLKDLEDEAGKTKSIFDNMGEYIKRGIGIGIGGDIWDKAKEGIGELITFGGDWQKSLNGIQAQTGATNDEMAQFNDQIEAVYNNNFGSSVEDVAESFAEVRQYMQGTGEDLQTVTQNAIGFRDTFGVEVPESMRSVQALMKQFGLTSEEAFNLLAQGQQQGLNYSDELFDSVNEYSVQFGKLGLNAQDMFNIFSSGAQNGAFNLDKVGDAVKELSIRVIDGSKTTQSGFQALGLNADEMAAKFGAGGDSAKAAFYQVIDGLKNMDDPVQQSIAGVDLFGTQWEDLGPQVVTSLGSVQGAFDQTKNSMDAINQVKYNTPVEALQGLGREIETSVLLPVSQQLMPSLNDLAKQLSNAFAGSDVQSSIQNLSSSLGEFIKNIADSATTVLPKLLDALGWILDNAGTIAGGIVGIGTAFEVFKTITVVSSAIGSVISAIGTISGAIAVVTTGAAAATPAIAGLAAVFTFLTGPIGIAIAAITAIVAGITYLWNTNEGFRDAIISAWNEIANFFTVTVPAAFQTVIDFITNNWQELLLFIVNPFAGAFALLYNNFDGFRTFVDGFIQGVKDFFVNGWNDIVTFFTTSVPAWLDSMGTWFSELPGRIAYGLGQALGSATQWEAEMWNSLSTAVPQWIESVATWFSELPGRIWDWLVQSVTNIGTWGENLLAAGTIAVYNLLDSIGTWFSELPGRIWTWLVNSVSNLGTWGSDMYNAASTEVSNVISGIEEWFSELPSKMLDIGGNIVAGLKEGIQNAWGSFKGWVGSLVDDFKEGFTSKDGLDIHSPSRVMRQIGNYAGEGFQLGIGDTIGSISKQANALANAAIPNVNAGSFDMGVNSMPIGSNSISTSSNMDALLSKLDSMTQAILNMQILMDGKQVGKLVTPTVSNQLAFNNGRKGF